MDLDRQVTYTRACEQMDAGRYAEAAVTLRALLEHFPDLEEARLELARAHFLDGDPISAQEELVRATRQEWVHPAVWVNLAASLGALGKLDEERTALGKVEFPGREPAEFLFARCLNALDDGGLRTAEEHCRKLREAYPEDPGGFLLEGLLRERQEDPGAAEKCFAEAAGRAPDCWLSRYSLGRMRLETGDAAGAVKPLEEALELVGRRWEILLALGNARLALEEQEAAIALLAEAVRLSPDGEVRAAHNLGSAFLEWGRAQDACVLLRAAAGEADEDAELRLLLARACFASGQYEEAATLYGRVVEDDPLHFRAHYNLGYSLERTGRDTEAVDVYERALKRRPTHYKTMNKLSRLRARQGDFAAALQLAERSLVQEQDANGEGYLSQGRALKGLRRFDEAREALAEAARRDSKNAVVWKELAFLHRRQGAVEEAKDAAKRALACGQDDPEALLELGLAYLASGGKEAAAKAKVAFKRALEHGAAPARTLAGLAQASALVDSPTRALEYAQAAVEKGGGYRAHYAMGLALQGLERPEKAIEAFKRCLTRKKGFAGGYLGISESYQALGVEEKAVKYRQHYEELRRSRGDGEEDEEDGGEERTTLVSLDGPLGP